jgi:hypothetical protein
MKKAYCILFSALLMVACGDDNSSSANDNELSSSSEETSIESSTDEEIVSSSSEKKENQNSSSSVQEANSSSGKVESLPSDDGWITTISIDHFSFFDEEHLRYYFLEEECDYDSATNSFKWVAEDYTGIFDRYDVSPTMFQSEYGGDSLKYMIERSFGFKMSNDTLYECDYIGNECDDPSEAYVYVGNSNSIFSTWEFVGRIRNGTFVPAPSNYKTTLILEPTQRTIKSSFTDIYKLYGPGEYCYQIYQIFEDESKEMLCRNYFIENPQVTSDTAFIASGLWFLQKDSNTVNISVDGKVIEISTTLSMGMQPTQYTNSVIKVSHQGTTCTNWYKNLDVTQEYCEATEHDMDFLKNDYSNIHHAFVDQLLSYSNNDDEFEECIKQFNLK